MKILVTGGAGFIGSHLVDALIEKGHQVRVFDNLEPQVHKDGKLPAYFNRRAEFIKGDVRDVGAFAEALRDIEVVYHLAAAVGIGQSMYQIKKYTDVNIGGTANLLEILTTSKNAVKKIVLSSSATAYGEGTYTCVGCGPVDPPIRSEAQIERGQWDPLCPHCQKEMTPTPITEDKPLTSRFLYAISKQAQEDVLLSVGKIYGIPVTALRFFNVFGPRQSLTNPHTAVFAVFSSRLKAGKPPIIIEDGNQTRDFVYVSDVAQAAQTVGELGRADFEVINIGSGRPTSINRIAQTLIKLFGQEGKIEPKINFIFRKGDVRHCFADTNKAKKLLNWEPKVLFEEGVRAVFEWAKNEESEDGFEAAFEEMIEKGLTGRGK